MTAPFAFLGPAYDAKLKKVYTSIHSSDIFQLKPLLGIFDPDAIPDAIGRNDPLAKLTAEYVDERMLKDIAAEHAKGRRLYIGTTALDAQRPVIWNMGAIAASGHPSAALASRGVQHAAGAGWLMRQVRWHDPRPGWRPDEAPSPDADSPRPCA